MSSTNILLAVGLSILCVGCVQNRPIPPAVFAHSTHGEVLLPDERYDADKLSCKLRVYQKGVLINGEQTQDRETIDATVSEAFSWYVRQVQAMRSSQRAAAIGHSTGMAVAGINVPVMLPSSYGLENPEFPEKYHHALRAHGEVGACMLEMGWKRKKDG